MKAISACHTVSSNPFNFVNAHCYELQLSGVMRIDRVNWITAVACCHNCGMPIWHPFTSSLKLIFIDYKYGRIWYQCKGNDMRIIITLIPNKKKNLERRNRQSKTAKTPLPKSDPNTSLKDTNLWRHFVGHTIESRPCPIVMYRF